MSQHHRVALFGRPESPNRLRPKSFSYFCQRLFIAGIAAKQVDCHDAVFFKQLIAMLIKFGAVEHRGSSLVIVQIDMQQINGFLVLWFLNLQPSIGFNDCQPLVVFGELEPSSSSVDDLRVNLNRGGRHA